MLLETEDLEQQQVLGALNPACLLLCEREDTGILLGLISNPKKICFLVITLARG